MSVLKVIKYGHPTLRKTAEPVKPEEIDKQFLQDMLETMEEEDGVGLAANQVDVAKQIITITDFEKTYILINPKITACSENMVTGKEGCLSLPGLEAQVPRSEKVIVSALDENGVPVEIIGRGLLAVVLQHEIDHLNGVMYIDRADPATLVWQDNEETSGLPATKNTTLDEVQTLYKSMFHKDMKTVIFDPVK
ncbi:MAG TPA: peptide deformylase [bacterium]|nr:peptide deformylase [bacterium]HPN45360.1 peptide deformylase [bacterium]